MEQNSIAKTSGIGLRDKFGYALGDVGSLLVFGLMNQILQIYYTDYLSIAPLTVMLIFMVARVWDAVNDPIWGGIIDKVSVSKAGTRYKRWLVWLSVPLAVSAILLFADVRSLPAAIVTAYAGFTYILFGMLYTGVNIPYGSMSSVITTNEKERNSLSVFRSVGSTLGGFGATVLYMLCYSSDTKEFNYTVLISGVAILSVLSVVAFLACSKLSKERVISIPEVSREGRKGETIAVVKGLMKSRTFVTMSIVGMLFLAEQMFQTSYNTYLFKYYFDRPGLAALTTICQYLPVALVMAFAGKLAAKFGRKEVCAAGILFSGVIFLILGVWQTTSAVVFLGMTFLVGAGTSFIFLMVWALANDAIDDYEVSSGRKDSGTAYSLFTFMRKLGQTLAAVVVNICLISMGYGQNGSASIENVTVSMARNMYIQATVVPCILCLAMFVILMFMYPLDKEKLAALQLKKARIFGSAREPLL